MEEGDYDTIYYYFALNRYHFTIEYWMGLNRYQKAVYIAMIDERVKSEKEKYRTE